MWTWVGTIAASYFTYLESVPKDLIPVFETSLKEAELHCLKLLHLEPLDLNDTYYINLSSFALAGHPY